MSSQITIMHPPGNCPDAVQICRFVAGMLSKGDATTVMDHLSRCAACAATLRMVLADAPSDLTAEETEVIDTLSSAKPEGRGSIARNMRARQRGFGPMLRTAAAITGMTLALGGGWVAFKHGRRSPEERVAIAYSTHRPFRYRLQSGGGPGPVRIDRAERSLTNLPTEVVDTLETIGESVSKAPDDPNLLTALGEARLLAWDLDGATQVLERAHQLRPADERTTASLATVYALRSEQLENGDGDRPLMQSALRLFEQCLRERPADTAVRFNRALALKNLGRYQDAAADLQLCLRDESNPAWAEEIKKLLSSLPPKPR